MDWHCYIEANPAVLVGKPVLKGTRLAVEFILDLIAGGTPESEILENYPGVTPSHIRACIAYAADIVRSERVVPLAS